MNVVEFMTRAVESGASDIFLVPGMPYSYKLGGSILYQGETRILPAEMNQVISEVYKLANRRDITKVTKAGDDDFSFAIPGVSRFRASVMLQRGSLAAIIRIVRFELPDFDKLHIPKEVINIASFTKGLVLVTGPAGSGKSTTLACLVDEINRTRNAHVITLEDPIEFLHRHNKGVITQREIGTDTESYMVGLKAALRQAPDVILLGEMRDYETIKTAMTAAETGHLVLSTLHTIGAANSITRIIDSFPSNQQEQIRTQLAMVLQAVVSQQLIPVEGEKEERAAWETMFVNNAIRTMIRESMVHQIDGVIASSGEAGMMTMDNSIYKLYKDGIISADNAIIHSLNSELMAKKINR